MEGLYALGDERCSARVALGVFMLANLLLILLVGAMQLKHAIGGGNKRNRHEISEDRHDERQPERDEHHVQARPGSFKSLYAPRQAQKAANHEQKVDNQQPMIELH